MSGFRSYHDCTIDLSAGLNLILGHNGSGKSNIICALDFILTKNYTFLDASQREMLICQKNTGNKVPIATVEIEFDNSDFYFPTKEEQLVVKRQLSKNCDQYMINEKLSNYNSLQTMLEFGGFSINNSYYLVKQGLINTIATSSSQYLLDILEGISGADVYDNRKKSSLKLLKNSALELDKLKSNHKQTEDYLRTLNIDENLFRKFQELELVYKYLLGRQNRFEVAKYAQLFKQSERESERLLPMLNSVYGKVNDIETRIDSKQEDAKKLEIEIESLKDKLEAKRVLIRKLTETISNIDQSFDSQSLAIQETCESVEDVERLRKDHEASYLKIQAELQVLRAEVLETKKHIAMLDAKKSNFALLRRFLAELDETNVYQSIDYLLQDLLKKLDYHNKRKTDLAKLISNLNEKANLDSDSDNQDKVELRSQCSLKITQLKQELAQASYVQKNLSTQIGSEQKKIIAIEGQISEKEDKLNLLSNMALQGRRSIKTLMTQFNSLLEEPSNSPRTTDRCQRILQGYYGQVIDWIELANQDELDRPVEALVHNSLFYHIVEDEEIANEILHEIEKRGLRGNFRFLPLQRLVVAPRKFPTEFIFRGKVYALLNKIRYNAKVDAAIQFVFGGKFVCDDFETCCLSLEASSNCDFATINGDKINRKGLIVTFGDKYPQTRRTLFNSWLEMVGLQRDLRANLDKYENEASNLKIKINSLAQELEELENNYRELGADLKQNNRSSSETFLECAKRIDELQNKMEETEVEIAREQAEISFWQSCKQARLAQLQSRINREAKDHNLKSLSDEQSQMKINYNLLIKEKMSKELDLNEERNKLAELKQLQSSAKSSKGLKKSNVRLLLETSNYEEKLAETLQNDEKAFKELSDLIDVKSDQLSEAIKDLDHEKAGLQEASKELKIVRKKYQKSLKMQQNYKELVNKSRSEWENVSTSGVPEKYLQLEGHDDVSEALKTIAKELDVLNKKKMTRETIRIYQNLLEMQRKLTLNLKLITDNIEATQAFIQTIDAQKTNIIVRTFRQVNVYFQEIFRKFVPSGSAYIQFLRSDSGNETQTSGGPSSISNSWNDSTISGFETLHRVMKEFIGLEILVSFTARTPNHELSLLSGGQKSLVSLSFILALQRVDPTPFCIFDEIDENLDSAYLDAVANLIGEQSKTKQFLATTFRKPLVERGESFFWVTNSNGLSNVQTITKDQALEFVNTELAAHDPQ